MNHEAREEHEDFRSGFGADSIYFSYFVPSVDFVVMNWERESAADQSSPGPATSFVAFQFNR